VRKMLSQVVPFLLLAAMPLTSFAAVTDLFKLDGTKNEVKFINREVFMRQDGDVWNTVVDPIDDQGNVLIAEGDVLVTLFTATTLSWGQNLENSGWIPSDSTGYLLGYAAQKVMAVSQGTAGSVNFIALDLGNPTDDPFDRLDTTKNQQVAIYNSTSQWVVNGKGLSVEDSVAQSLANAGNPWEVLSDALGYPNSDDFAQTSGVIVSGAPFMSAQYALTAGGLSGLSFTPNDWLNTGKLSDMAGRANADLNDDYLSGDSPWMFDSQDPLVFAAVPEPATLAMWGGFLAIGAVVALRRRQK